jgi:hypothetical protein
MNHKVYSDIMTERQRQDDKWGEQNHSAMEWLSILMEEIGEAAEGANEAHWHGGDYASYREEMVHSAAVIVAAIEDLDRKHGDGEEAKYE